MKKIAIVLWALLVGLTAFAKVDVVAHATYWNCERGGHARNSMAGVQSAFEQEFEWCEFDINFTKDGKSILYHNGADKGHVFNDSNYSELSEIKLTNGEDIPLLETALKYAAKNPQTKLLVELKYCKTPTMEVEFAHQVVKEVKKAGLLAPGKIGFISFSQQISKTLAEELKGFDIQFITYNKAPEAVAKLGVNGVDYEYHYILRNPDAVKRAHKLGLTVNVWTCDNKDEMIRLLDAGIDMLTTNLPELARQLINERDEQSEYTAIDLGLSVKWADKNFGAQSATELGDCFCWADACNVRTKDGFRLPTFAEMEELMTKCTWSVVTEGNVKCHKITGPTGNSILLPVLGYRDGGKVVGSGNVSYFWSSTKSPYFEDEAMGIMLYHYGTYIWYSGWPDFNFPLRLVK